MIDCQQFQIGFYAIGSLDQVALIRHLSMPESSSLLEF